MEVIREFISNKFKINLTSSNSSNNRNRNISFKDNFELSLEKEIEKNKKANRNSSIIHNDISISDNLSNNNIQEDLSTKTHTNINSKKLNSNENNNINNNLRKGDLNSQVINSSIKNHIFNTISNPNNTDNYNYCSNNNNNYKEIISETLQDELNDECKMTFKGLAIYNGFEVEEHDVITKDNYILTIFKILTPEEDEKRILKRIIKKKQKNILNKKPAFEGITNTRDYICFFQHGLLDSSDGWICNFPNKNLPYIMAKNGFEVWVGNSRGNKYSKSHQIFNPLTDENKQKFFDFSFDELGKYDIPACLNYILNQKNKQHINNNLFTCNDNIPNNNNNNDHNNISNLDLSVNQLIGNPDNNSNNNSTIDLQIDYNNTSFNLDASALILHKGYTLDKVLKDYPSPSKRVIYFGHSQGCASIVSSLSVNNDYYKSIIKAVVLLAPACRLISINSTFIHLIEKLEIDKTIQEKKVFEVLPFNQEVQSLSVLVNSIFPSMSMALFEEVSDEDCLVNCPNRLKIFLSHYPSGTSIRCFLHFRQLYETQKFQSFDFGNENETRYRENNGKVIDYEIDKIKGIPIIMCCGGKDKLVNINDVRWLKEMFLKGKKKRRVFSNIYNEKDIERYDIKENNSENNNQLDYKNKKSNDEYDYEACKINDDFDCPLFSYYEFESMGHLSFLLNSDISWFDYVLKDIYNLITNYK